MALALQHPTSAELPAYLGTRSPNYARRRLVALIAVMVLVAVATVAASAVTRRLAPVADGAPRAVTASSPVGAAVSTDGASSTSFVVVRPGDSLWTIARRLQPEGDVRPLVHELARANGGSGLEVGQRLEVPSRG